jgi:hypothetical protein
VLPAPRDSAGDSDSDSGNRTGSGPITRTGIGWMETRGGTGIVAH